MGPIWAHLGTILVPSRIHHGSLMGPFWTHLGPFWFLRGSSLDLWRAHLGPSLETPWFPFGSSSDPWGADLGPSWNHSGSYSGPSWIIDGSLLTHFGALGSFVDPSWILERPILGPTRTHHASQMGPTSTHLGNLLVCYGIHIGSWRAFLGPPWNHCGSMRVHRGSSMDPTWPNLGTILISFQMSERGRCNMWLSSCCVLRLNWLLLKSKSLPPTTTRRRWRLHPLLLPQVWTDAMETRSNHWIIIAMGVLVGLIVPTYGVPWRPISVKFGPCIVLCCFTMLSWKNWNPWIRWANCWLWKQSSSFPFTKKLPSQVQSSWVGSKPHRIHLL